MATTMDLLPTFAALTGTSLPTNRKLDGHDIFQMMINENEKSPYDVFYYYQLEQLQAVRKGDWKLHLPLDSMYGNFHQAKIIEGRSLSLYNLSEDISESQELSAQHPEIVEELLSAANLAIEELGTIGIKGKEVRSAAIVEDPIAQIMKTDE